MAMPLRVYGGPVIRTLLELPALPPNLCLLGLNGGYIRRVTACSPTTPTGILGPGVFHGALCPTKGIVSHRGPKSFIHHLAWNRPQSNFRPTEGTRDVG
jgi:hypothetical protein